MHLLVKLIDEYKKIDDLEVGDMVLCDNGEYMPIKSIVYISCYPKFCATSDNKRFTLSSRVQIKTATGFKSPELWDIIPITDEFMPMFTYVNKLDKVSIFRDILIDGNMVTPEGIVFRYCDEKDANGKETK
jgi:hypothetical protein